MTLKKMKKLILTLVLALTPSLFFAQTTFDKYDGQEGVTSVIISKKMFELMSNIKMDTKDKEAQQYLTLVKKLENLKVFVTSNKTVTSDMKLTSAKYLKSASLEELMRINDEGKNIKIYVKSGNTSSKVKELLMFIEGGSTKKGDETVLMSLKGDFDLNELSVLTDKMNLPGGDQLKKSTKGAKGTKGPK